MNTIMKLALVATLAIFAQNVNAQENNNQSKQEVDKQEQIAYLKERRVQVETDWKNTLKYRVERIIKDSKELGRSEQEIETLKKAAAQEVALNIQNQQTIIDNQIALVERTGYADPSVGSSVEIGFGGKDSEGNRVLGVAYNSNKSGTRRYDVRTYGENVFAFGLNNVISENAEIGDDFSIGRSRFFEYGYALKTRVFKNSGALHFKYGLSIQINKLVSRNNETLVIGDDGVSFQEFPFELRKSQLRGTNLVIPLHLEFGGWKKEQGEDYVRYRTAGKFRMGVGVYAGVSLGEQQKLKYREDGNRVKIKNRRDFGGDNFVFGLSSYIRLYDDLSLYGKYDLSSIVEIEGLGEVNNVSLGLRWDL
jgi:hypothetical protein